MNEETLSAAVGRSCLNPTLGAPAQVCGARARLTSVHDDLFATALVLDSGYQQIAWLGCDLLSVHPDYGCAGAGIGRGDRWHPPLPARRWPYT